MKNLALLCLLLIALALHAQSPSFGWATKMDLSTGSDYCIDAGTDNAGNTYVLGGFSGKLDADPGPDSIILDAGDQHAFFIIKWNNLNAVEWAVHFISNNDYYPYGFAVDANGNVFLGGEFSIPFDADPGPGENMLVPNGVVDGFVIKLYNSGQFAWAQKVGGTEYDRITGLAADPAGNVCATGSFSGTVDFDPGPGTTNITSANTTAFVWKLDQDGNHEWVRVVKGTGSAEGAAVAIGPVGSIVFAGGFEGTVDLNPGAGFQPGTSAGANKLFVLKLTYNGGFEWAESFGNGGVSDLATDNYGNVYTLGRVDETADFDPGPGVRNLYVNGGSDIFVQKLKSSGHFAWASNFGSASYDEASGIDVDDAGNVYTTGTYAETTDFNPGPGTFELSTAGLSDFFTQKLDKDGDFQWVKSYGSYQYDYAAALVVNNNNELITCGSFGGTVDFDPGDGEVLFSSHGIIDAFVQKTTTGGDFVWAAALGTEEGKIGTQDVVTDLSGNVFTTGFMYGKVDAYPGDGEINLVSRGMADVFLQKIDGGGQLIWALSLGGALDDVGRALHTDPQGNILLTGTFNGVVDFDPGPGTVLYGETDKTGWFVLKLTAGGQFVWAQTSSGYFYTNPYDMTMDPSGNILLTGSFSNAVDFDPGPGIEERTSNGGTDIFVLKLNHEGNFQWVQTAGGSGNDFGAAVETDADGRVVVGGNFMHDVDFDPGPGTSELQGSFEFEVFIEKFDPQGSFLWAKQMGSAETRDLLTDLTIDIDGNLYLTGTYDGAIDADPGPGYYELATNGLADAFLVKTDPDGNLLNALHIGGPTNDYFQSVDTDGAGNVYVAGLCSGPVDLDPSDDGVYWTTSNLNNAFVIKFNKNGLFRWASTIPSLIDIYNTFVCVDVENNVITTGNFVGTVEGDGFFMYSPEWNTYVVKLEQTATGLNSLHPKGPLRAWPNPTTGPLTIDLGEQPLDVEVTVTGVEGKLLKRLYFENAQTLDVPLDGLMPGVYFVSVRGEGVLATVRVVKN